MKESKVETYLFCVHCKQESLHTILYINNEIVSVECNVCTRKQEIKYDVKKKFYKELYYRISTKPSRITEEYKRDLNHFLLSLPLRMMSKPYRLMKDLNTSRKIINHHKK